MPAGKGTYGSKKGRPKKKMGPKGGGFSKLPKAVQNKILKKKK
jgi:protoporphyrinogen oxidase|tara:strand:+ start:1667 stop:1795 length:129 start_codon:yes stop_codon:yes gene_type:complete